MEQATLLQNPQASLSQAQINMAFGWKLEEEPKVRGKNLNKISWKKSPYFALLQAFPYSTLETREDIPQDDIMKRVPYPCLYGLLEISEGQNEGFAVSQFVVMQILGQKFGFSASYAELSQFELALMLQILKPVFEKDGARLTLGTSIYTLSPLWDYDAIEAIVFKDNHNDSAEVQLYKQGKAPPPVFTDVILTAFPMLEEEFEQLSVGQKIEIGRIVPKTAFVYQKDQLKPFTLALKDNHYTIEELKS